MLYQTTLHQDFSVIIFLLWRLLQAGSSEGSGGGMCVKECKGSSGSCGSHEFCIDNKLLGDDSSGGSCIFRACNGQIPCPGSATCVQGENVSQCLQTCVGFGNCANPVQECAPGTEFGDICVPSPCSGDFECSGGYCSGTDNPLGGQCIRNCAPTNECGAGSNCIPPGYVNDPTVIKGICTQPGCKTDSDCDSGHTCVITDDIPDGSCQPIGDPAFILSVPVEQFRKDYVFLAPNAYKEDYVNIVAPGSAQVTMDGNPIGEDRAGRRVQGGAHSGAGRHAPPHRDGGSRRRGLRLS